MNKYESENNSDSDVAIWINMNNEIILWSLNKKKNVVGGNYPDLLLFCNDHFLSSKLILIYIVWTVKYIFRVWPSKTDLIDLVCRQGLQRKVGDVTVQDVLNSL